MRFWVVVTAAALWASAASAGAAGLCARYAHEWLGELDPAVIREASGLAVSRAYPGRLYHNNDSGDAGRFYMTDMAGEGTRTVAVAGFEPVDVEAMALGPCGERMCLYLGDIGDNMKKRQNVRFVLIEERERFGREARPLRVVTARYPDGAHDAEAFALHPDGDLYLITKPIDFAERRAGPAQIFRLTAAQLAEGGEQTFAPVGEVDLPYLLYDEPVRGQLATALDIAPDGKRFLILTYTAAVEVAADLAAPLKPSRTWKPGADYQVTRIARLPQAEAIAYLPDGAGFLYDTEVVEGFEAAPIYRARCRRPE